MSVIILIIVVSFSVTDTNTDIDPSSCYGENFVPNHPSPKSPLDFGQAFCSIMFSFSGASTFPTIQTDMRNRELFPKAAVFGMLSKYYQHSTFESFTYFPQISVCCALYLPMSVMGWWFLGDMAGQSVVSSLCDGPVTSPQ